MPIMPTGTKQTRARLISLVTIVTVGLLVGLIYSQPVLANGGGGAVPPAPIDCSRSDLSPTESARCGIRSTQGGQSSSNPEQKINDTLTAVVGVLAFIVGVMAVIVIIIQGLRLIASGGDSNTANSARNGIIYALVGLAVALLANPLVEYFIGFF